MDVKWFLLFKQSDRMVPWFFDNLMENVIQWHSRAVVGLIKFKVFYFYMNSKDTLGSYDELKSNLWLQYWDPFN